MPGVFGKRLIGIPKDADDYPLIDTQVVLQLIIPEESTLEIYPGLEQTEEPILILGTGVHNFSIWVKFLNPEEVYSQANFFWKDLVYIDLDTGRRYHIVVSRESFQFMVQTLGWESSLSTNLNL